MPPTPPAQKALTERTITPTGEASIVKQASAVLTGTAERFSAIRNPYGDGLAGERAERALAWFLDLTEIVRRNSTATPAPVIQKFW